MSEFAVPLTGNGARGAGRHARRKAEYEHGAARDVADGLLKALMFVAAFVAAAVALAVLVPPALRITRYEISGAVSLGSDEILSSALIHEKEYFMSVDPSRIRANILANPRVAGAKVARRFPNTLRIALVERKPVAAVLAELGGRPAAVYLDAEGVAFAQADPAALGSLPVVSGLRFEDFRLGARLPASLVPILVSLGEIEAGEPALLAAFSEIRIVKPRYGEPELVLYPLQYRIPVRAGAVLNPTTLRSIILVLDVLGTRGAAAAVEEIDFRTGRVVYRSKEGWSGR